MLLFFSGIQINREQWIKWGVIGLGAVVGIVVLWLIFRSPFKYPYFMYSIDISGRRQPEPEDLIDEFLIAGGFQIVNRHECYICDWKKKCEAKIERSILKRYRRKQFEKCLDDSRAFHFSIVKGQTRYTQQNYVRQSYKVNVEAGTLMCDYSYLFNRNEALKDIDYETTLRKYHVKNQRKLLTRELRKEIIERDNYTCQICGKYMPDEVGLHIDHIVPIAKGGKTVKSNLQVLCSKCNGKKSSKTPSDDDYGTLE